MWKRTKSAKTPQRPSHPSIERARKVAKILDSAITIPIIRKKIGLDPLLGMLPVTGDLLTGLMALYLIWVAYELRLPRPVLIRMAANTTADILLGMIPVIGDVSDFFWKSNDKNFKLLEESYQKHGVGSRHYANSGHTVVDIIAEPAT